MNCIPIDEAIKVVQEYRTWLDTKATPEDMDVDETEVTNGDDMTMEEEDNTEGKQSNEEEELKFQKLVDKRLRD